MTIISTIAYVGDLRTSSIHRRSGVHINTDAPVDNKGRGACFSPTDLIANSLGSCMITLMGIIAEKHEIQLGEISAEIGKVMGSNPRRVAEIDVYLKIEDINFSEREKNILETAAINCPVAKSLHPNIVQSVEFNYFVND